MGNVPTVVTLKFKSHLDGIFLFQTFLYPNERHEIKFEKNLLQKHFSKSSYSLVLLSSNKKYFKFLLTFFKLTDRNNNKPSIKSLYTFSNKCTFIAIRK